MSKSIFEELKRRNVFRVGIAYVVTAWLLLQIADIVLDAITAPDWVMKVFMLMLALGFPLSVIFAWAFELTPEGLKKEQDVERDQSITNITRRKLDYIIIAMLILAVGYFLWEKYAGDSDPMAARSDIAAAQTKPPESENTGATPSGLPGDPSIAVLPFLNLSSDPEQEFFSDGISEELLNVLAKYPGLRVAARTSSFQFKGQNQDVSEIARQLKVNHILEGSVRKAGSRLRITAQLIDARTGFHLWSEAYDRELNDIFLIQDEISAAIGDALRSKLALDGSPTAPRVPESANTAAYEAFLQGRHLINQRGGRNIERGVEHLERSVRLDPDFAPGHAWLAIGYALLLNSPSSYGDLTLDEVRERAIPEYEKALALDPLLAEGYGAMALVASNSNDLLASMEYTKKALELNPIYVDAMNWRQIAAGQAAEYEESINIIARIIEVDPLSIVGRLNYAQLFRITNPERAREFSLDLIEQNSWAGYSSMGNIEMWPSGNLSQSLEWFLNAYEIDPEDEFSNQYIMSILSWVGLFDEARRISDENLHLVDASEGRLEDAIERLAKTAEEDPLNVAPKVELADALHAARRFGESNAIYEELAAGSHSGLVFESRELSTISHVRMACGLLNLGKETEAGAALDQHFADFEKRQQANLVFPFDEWAQALAHAASGNEGDSVEALHRAIDIGLRDPVILTEPCFDSMQSNDAFVGLGDRLMQLIVAERTEILQMICYNNPAPNTWQPLRQTCEGVSKPR